MTDDEITRMMERQESTTQITADMLADVAEAVVNGKADKRELRLAVAAYRSARRP